MADAYLNVAERVIQTSRRPLRPKEIIHRAYAEGLLPWHLHGSRQDKTLHARMSEDVARNPEGSRFFRTAPGVFFLKDLLGDPTIPDAFKQVYFAPPRRKELRRDHVLTIDHTARLPQHSSSFIPVQRLHAELDEGRYAYRSYQEIVEQSRSAAVHSFVLVFHDDKVLSYRCGKFAPTSDPLYGMRSIGLGGAVYASDHDLLFKSMHGIIASGINELGYGIGLPRRLAERARYDEEVTPHIGVLLPGTEGRPTVVHVVLSYECPPEFLPSKAALSINDLRWLSVENVANTLDDYDETSRLLFLSGKVAEFRAVCGATGGAR